MLPGENKIRSFSDLKAWQESYKLTLVIYEITNKFPKEEIYSLTSQMRRAVISISSNIAEGFSRSTSKDKIQFYTIAQGSLTELHSQIMIAKGLNYIHEADVERSLNQLTLVGRLIFGLKKIKNNI